MHPPGPEADHLTLPCGLLAARRLGRDPRGLAEEAEEGRLVLRPVHVDALDGENGLVGPEHRPLVHGGHVDRQPFEEVGGLLDSRQDPQAQSLGRLFRYTSALTRARLPRARRIWTVRLK